MSRIVKNSVFNLGGQVLPLIIALAAMPVSLHGLGLERFGVLLLAWSLLGYFVFFDLGLGRGTTRFFAEALANNEPDRLQSIFWVSTSLNVVVGLVGLVAMVLLAPVLVGSVSKVPATMVAETTTVFILLAFSIPMITVTAVFRGVLEAAERFDLVSIIKAPSNGSLFLIPLVCVPLGAGLITIVLLLVLSRIATAIVFYIMVARLFPQQTRSFAFRRDQAVLLLRYGGWVTVTNLLNPFVIYGERLIIATVLSLALVSYYSAPYELISRIAIIPFSLSLTLFPMFSGRTTMNGAETLNQLVVRPSKYLLLLMTPIAALFIAFAPEILRLWLGADFAEKSTTLLRILAVSFFFNSLGYVPLAAVQGLGRPDLKAKLDMVATVIFGAAVWMGIAWFGITGAAWAKLVVTLFDTIGLLWCTITILRVSPRALFVDGFGGVTIASLAMLGAMLLVSCAGGSLILRATLLVLTATAFVVIFFKTAVTGYDRIAVSSMLARMRRAG
jgi:O-antigen/teichoic acid export membrane protein